MTVFLFIFGIMLVLILLGVPVAVSIGLSALLSSALFSVDIALSTAAAKCFYALDSYSLMAIPFFILAGELMNTAEITRKVLDIADALVGHLKGGLTYVNCLAAMMMASISGSGTACAAALGVSLVPDMEKRGYSREYAVALTSCANVVGPIIPPSTLFILFSYYTGASISRLFLGGVVPGILTGLALMLVGSLICRKKGYCQEAQKFSPQKLLETIRTGWIAALVPVFLFLSIMLGWCTATEAGAIVSLISLVLGVLMRSIRSWRDVAGALKRTALSTCTIFTLQAVSGIFSNVLVRARFTDIVSDFLGSVTDSHMVALFLICAFIFVLGMVLDVIPMITMFSLTFATAVLSMGGNLTHIGVIFTLICMVGAVTPPVGGVLFVTTTIGKISMTKIIPMLFPMLVTLLVIVVLLVVFPPLVTFLPNLILGPA